MKKILFYISFLLVILLLLSMDCSPKNEKGRISGGERIEEYYIGDHSSDSRFVKKEDTFYIVIKGQNKILTYNIVNKELDIIESSTMGNIFSSADGFTIYKDSFLFAFYGYIVITDDFENYKTYSIPYYDIRDIAYSEREDYFIYITSDRKKLVKIDYDLSNDQFVYNDIIEINRSSVFPCICLYDYFVWMFSRKVDSYNFYVYIFNLYLLKPSKGEFISINDYTGYFFGTSEYVKNFIPYDLWYEGDEFLYILSNGGEKDKLYIEKIKLDDKSFPL